MYNTFDALQVVRSSASKSSYIQSISYVSAKENDCGARIRSSPRLEEIARRLIRCGFLAGNVCTNSTASSHRTSFSSFMMPPGKNEDGVKIVPIAAQDTYKLRHEVLWPNASLQEVQLAVDPVSIHLGAYVHEQENSPGNRTPIGVITIHVTKPEDKPSSAESSSVTLEAQFRKLAVAPEWQGRGIGSKLVKQAGVVASDAGAHSLWCDARTSALAFYERLSMQTEGSSFMRKGVEYVKMRRALV
jgi:GNAT superfamily N-acetyltransferase